MSSYAKNSPCKSQVWVLTGHSDLSNLQLSVCSKINYIFRDKHYMKHQCHLKTQIPPGASEEALLWGAGYSQRQSVRKLNSSGKFKPHLSKDFGGLSPATINSGGWVCLIFVKSNFWKRLIKIFHINPDLSISRHRSHRSHILRTSGGGNFPPLPAAELHSEDFLLPEFRLAMNWFLKLLLMRCYPVS